MTNKIRNSFAALAILLTASLSANAQDKIVNKPIQDRAITTMACASLEEAISTAAPAATDLNNGLRGSDLYKSWNNQYVHCYKTDAKPDSFCIDLSGFCMPTPSRSVTSNFGYRPKFKRYHKGLDIKVQTGDTIYAAFDGTVRVVRYEANGYGNFVVIRHANGLETIYGHLSKQLCSANQEVKAGEPIGLGGNTGRSYGSHLHFETRLLGEAIDPSLLFDFPRQTVVNDSFVYRKTDSHDGMVMARK